MNQRDKIRKSLVLSYQRGSPSSGLTCVTIRNFCSYLNLCTLGFHSLPSELNPIVTNNYGNPVLD